MTDLASQPATWLEHLPLTVGHLEDFELEGHDDVELDYSAASLDGLEQVVLDRFGVPDDAAFADERGLTFGVAAYLGEALLRVAGGVWDWAASDDPVGFPDGVPIVRADPELGLPPVSPVALIQEAVSAEDGRRFTTLHGEWQQAVENARRARPGWTPHKEPTILDPTPPSDALPAWLQDREAGFTDWVHRYGPGGPWNFSLDSLPALESLVARQTPTKTELHALDHRDFTDGAVWYYGEVVRRGLGGRWDADERDGNNLYRAHVEGVGPWKSSISPSISLTNSLTQPGYLKAHYEDFAT